MGACPCFGWRKGKKLRKDKEKEALNKAKTQLSKGAELQVLKKEAGQRAAAPAPRKGLNFDPGLPIFSYRELATATNNFRNDSLIGRGGFGAVYKGRLENGQVVAVKQLDKTGLQGDKEFLVEVLMLSLLRHTNLVSLIGYCAEGEQRLLVYEYMPLGSLEYHLHDLTREQKPLDWNTRMKIAAGAAKGLEYLHTGAQPPVIYRDLKSSNILLGEGYYPKLSDFGLAKFGPSGDASHVSTRVMGTHGYCAPEYMISGKLTMRSDIYSFGVFLLELISGRKALDETRERDQRSIVEWARPRAKENKNVLLLADPQLDNQFPKSTFRNVVEVAMLCTQENATARPTVTDLVRALDFLASNTYNPNEDRRSAVSKDQANEDSPTKTTRPLEKDFDREKAVAEAKMWGETWREKRRLQQTADKDADGVNDR